MDIKNLDRSPERDCHKVFNMTSKIGQLPGSLQDVDIVEIKVLKPHGIGGIEQSYMLRNGSNVRL